MAHVKLVLVGGGSPAWGPTVLQSILSNDYLDGCQVVLHDVDPQALERNLALAHKFAALAGRRVTFSQTPDQALALEGADYVVVTISTGGLEAMRVDLEVPQRYGLFQTVGDTVGPGGLSRALRNIPVFVHLARAMERHCPQAWMINCSNPLSALTRVVAKETAIRVVGLCHGVRAVGRNFADFLGADFNGCAYVNTGIDHCAWFTDFVVEGRSAQARLEEAGLEAWLALPPQEAEQDSTFGALYALRCGLALGRRLGALPAIGDRHMVEFLPDFLQGLDRVEHFGLKRTSIEDRQQGQVRARQRIDRLLAGEETVDFSDRVRFHNDDVAGWIAALDGGPPVEDNLNVPNIGQIPQLPPGAVVETRGVLDATGFRPLASPMPPAIEAVVRPHVLRQELTVEAGLEGNFGKALAALQSDPLAGHLDRVEDMLGQLMAGTKKWLPQFD